MAALWRDVSIYPPEVREPRRETLREYTRYVTGEAWRLRRNGIVPTHGTKILDEFQRQLLAFDRHGPGTHFVCRDSAAITVASTWFVVIDNLATHITLTAMFAAMSGLMIFLTEALDNPFRSSIAIGPEAFQLIFDRLMK